ncbi:phage tail family protein [Paenibacillus larvae]|nr:distal tail protein Dit [Paenibacillus larvae]MDT2238342.1 phage tail family protein [Paenibacillus larvae]
MLRIISDWLCTDKAAPLMFDDEPGKTYYAKISGDTQIDTLVSMGTGTIKFCGPLCIWHYERRYFPDHPSAVTNAGLADTYPVILPQNLRERLRILPLETETKRDSRYGSDDWQADSTAAGSGFTCGWYNVGRMADGK